MRGGLDHVEKSPLGKVVEISPNLQLNINIAQTNMHKRGCRPDLSMGRALCSVLRMARYLRADNTDPIWLSGQLIHLAGVKPSYRRLLENGF